jgi:type I restriction enzyme S subunit
VRATPKKPEEVKRITYEKMERSFEEIVNGELLMVNEKMKKWKEVKLGEVADIISGYAFKSTDLVLDEGLPIIKIANIKSQSVSLDFINYLPKEKYETKMEKYFLKDGDVLIAMTGQGSVGRIGAVKGLNFEVLVNQRVGIVRSKKEFSTQSFISSVLSDSNYEKILYDLGLGAGQPNISPRDIENLKIPLPPLPTQQRIAAILSSYDDLIENNRRRITLLEDSARLLYKEWFVKFQFPGHEKVKVKNGLPEGWGRKKIGDIIEVGRGSSPRPIADTRYFEDGTIPWIKIADATASKIFIHRTKEYVNEFGASFSRKLKPGSMILAASGTLGFPMFLGVEACIHDGWLYFEKIEEYFKEYFYFNLLDLRNYFQNQSLGSAIQNINTNVVRETPLILPQKQIINLFSEKTNPIFKQIHLLQVQTQKLREARNILLPKLMNGTIEV